MAEADTEKGLVQGDQPPPYTEPTEPQEPPPSYNSLFGEIKQARQESSGALDFLKKFFAIIFGTIGFLICLSLVLAIPIASIIIGVEYKDSCTIESKIPIYLIVLGAFGILRNVLGLFSHGKKKYKKQQGETVEEDGAGKRSCEGIIDCFLVAWFICGNVWIYSNYKPDFYNVNSPDYCHQTLYLFAFWLTTATYIVMGAFCFCGCCIAICAAMFAG